MSAAHKNAAIWTLMAFGSIATSVIAHTDLAPITFGCLAISNVWLAAGWLAKGGAK